MFLTAKFAKGLREERKVIVVKLKKGSKDFYADFSRLIKWKFNF